MWKNQTTPNLQLYLQRQSDSKQQANCLKLSTKKRIDSQFKPIRTQYGANDIQSKSMIYNSRGSMIVDKKSRCRYIEKQNKNKNNKTQLERSCSQINVNAKQQEFLLTELQQNQKLRINLFKAQKIIKDLDQTCQAMLGKSLNLLKQQKVSDDSKSKGKRIDQNQNIWKSNFNILFQFVQNFTKDVNFLASQYNELQLRNQQYKNTAKNIKKSEQKLIKILQHSNIKLEKSEQIIERLFAQIKQKDGKLEQYQTEYKNLNMKIVEQRDELQKIKKEAKQEQIGGNSYKQVAKSLKHQLQNMSKLCKEYQKEFSRRDNVQYQNKARIGSLQQKVNQLESQLEASKKFNENVISDYKKMTIKIEHQQQKLNEKIQNTEILHGQKIRQYEKYINILQRQKQLGIAKLQQKVEIKTSQIQKMNEIKVSLQKELLQRIYIINQLEQQNKKQRQNHEAYVIDLQTTLQQKERQIQYHQQLKVIANMKNQQLISELNEARCDMKTILQQLKVKELQIEKLKQIYSLKRISSNKGQLFANGHNSQQIDQQYKKSSQSNKNRSNKRQLLQIQIDNNQSSIAGGIVWRKLKRDSAIDENNISQYCNNVKSRTSNQKINGVLVISRDSIATNKNVAISSKQDSLIQNQQNQESSVLQVPQVANLQTSYRNPLQKIAQVETPKSKFSLQAFQNKMAIQEGAKIFFKLNKAMLR